MNTAYVYVQIDRGLDGLKTDLGIYKPVPVKNIRAINATNQLPIVLSFYLHIHSKHLYSHTSFLLSLPLLSLFLTFIPLLYPTQYHMQLGIIFEKKKTLTLP